MAQTRYKKVSFLHHSNTGNSAKISVTKAFLAVLPLFSLGITSSESSFLGLSTHVYNM